MSKIQNIVKRVAESKDGKTLLANFSYLSLLKIAGYVFPFLTMPYLARVLGVVGIGKIAFASSVIIWFQTLADWGFNLTATRDIAQNRNDIEKVSEIFSTVLWGRILLVVISFVALLLSIVLVPQFNEDKAILLITFLSVPGYILFPEFLFQGLEKMKFTTIFNLLIKLVFTIAVFLFIQDEEDYLIQPLLLSLGYIVSGIIAMYMVICKWNIKLRYIPIRKTIKAIKVNTDVFINQLMPNLYNSFPVVLLGFYHGNAAVGIYDAGRKFIQIIYQFMSVLSRTFFPFLARRLDKHSFYAKMYILISLGMSVMLFIFAPVLINLFYGSEFEDSVIILRIVSVSLLFLAISSVYGASYLLLIHEERLLRNITLIASVIGFSLAFPLVFYFNSIGNACIYLVSTMLLGSLSMYYSLKIKNKKLE